MFEQIIDTREQEKDDLSSGYDMDPMDDEHDQNIKQQDQCLLSDQDLSRESISKEVSNESLYDLEHVSNEGVTERVVDKSPKYGKLLTQTSQGQDTKFRCNKCTYVTFLMGDLTRHMKGTHGKAKVKCERCQISVRDNHTLKKHINDVHDKIRNHICEKCGYAATQKGSLTKHMDFVHKGRDKKFKCEQCPYASIQIGNLNNHIRAVHEKMPKIKSHVCEMCGFATSTKQSLEYHRDGFHKMGEKLRCNRCSYEVYSQRNLIKHMKNVHKEIIRKNWMK